MASKESTRVLPRGADAHALEDLLVRTAAGDDAAFRMLYDRSAGRLFAVCMRIARHRRMAEDMLQDTYVHIFRHAREFDPARGSALAWMIAIARSQAMDLIRLLKREDRPPDELTLEAAEPGALAGIEAKFELSALGRCLGELTDSERHAIILGYRDGLTYEQLSVLLGVSLETVKEQVGRGLKRLRECLEPP